MKSEASNACVMPNTPEDKTRSSLRFPIAGTFVGPSMGRAYLTRVRHGHVDTFFFKDSDCKSFCFLTYLPTNHTYLVSSPYQP